MSGDPHKTFYLETFGCQMNVHDSEKVVGTLRPRGLSAGGDRRGGRPDSLQHLLHPRQGRAEGLSSPGRLQEAGKAGQEVRRAGLRGAAGRRKDFRARAARFAGVRIGVVPQPARRCWCRSRQGTRAASPDSTTAKPTSASKPNSPRRTNPHRGYITIIEGCDKFCSYCVVPFTRGKERSRTSDSVLAEARQMADLGYTEIQLLGQNVNSYKDPAGKPASKSFAELLAAVGEVPGIRRVRFTTSHPRDFGRDIVDAIDAVPTLCDHVHLPVQSGSTACCDAMQRLYTREQYLERIAWMKSAQARHQHHQRHHRRLSRRDRSRLRRDLALLDEVGYDAIFAFKYSPRPNTPSLTLEDAIPDEEKARRLEVCMEKQREIQRSRYKKHIGQTLEVMVEGRNEARNQWIGRTSHNKTLNFTAPEASAPKPGSYVPVGTRKLSQQSFRRNGDIRSEERQTHRVTQSQQFCRRLAYRRLQVLQESRIIEDSSQSRSPNGSRNENPRTFDGSGYEYADRDT